MGMDLLILWLGQISNGFDGSLENGRVYVLYGPIAPGARISLDATDVPMSIIYGIDPMDHAGSTVACDDINGDGFDDVLIVDGDGFSDIIINGMQGEGPDNKRTDAGEAYAISGRYLADFFAPTSVASPSSSPKAPSLLLKGNYPNPFNTSTVIDFTIPQRANSFTRLSVYNDQGQLLRYLVAAFLPSGQHSVLWDGRDEAGRDMAGGIYFLHLQHGSYKEISKMTYLK